MGPTYKTPLTLKEKVEMIRSLNGVQLSSRKIAEKWKIGRSQVQQILKNKDELLRLYQSGMNEHKLRIHRGGPSELLDKAVLEWYGRVRSKNLPVRRAALQKKSLEIASALKIDCFKASDGWFDRFKKRHNIEANPQNQSDGSLVDWFSKIAEILEEYEARNIFNADETGLFYRALPDHTSCLKGKDCSEGEMASERLSVLLCASACGEKMKPAVVSKTQPKCFKNVNSKFGVYWKTDPKAWMTSALMEEWLKALDEEMKSQNRKILMFLDNATCHVRMEFENIRLVFFPPYVSPKSQPACQGIIQNFKIKYRQLVLQHLIAISANNFISIESVSKDIDILKASTWIERAWDDVTPTTITNGFKKAGFPGFGECEYLDHSVDNEGLNELLKICPGLADEDYVRIDENLLTESTSEDVGDILAAVDPQNEALYKKDWDLDIKYEDEHEDEECGGAELPIEDHTGALVELKRLQKFYMNHQDQKGYKMVNDLIMHHEHLLSLVVMGQSVNVGVQQSIQNNLVPPIKIKVEQDVNVEL